MTILKVSPQDKTTMSSLRLPSWQAKAGTRPSLACSNDLNQGSASMACIALPRPQQLRSYPPLTRTGSARSMLAMRRVMVSITWQVGQVSSLPPYDKPRCPRLLSIFMRIPHHLQIHNLPRLSIQPRTLRLVSLRVTAPVEAVCNPRSRKLVHRNL
jgi:hypothetical protein